MGVNNLLLSIAGAAIYAILACGLAALGLHNQNTLRILNAVECAAEEKAEK